MKTLQQIREATSGRVGVKCSGKKSQFGGYSAECKRGSKGVYSSQQRYKDAKTAKKHAEVYADAYYSMGDRAAQNAVRKFIDQNKDKLYTKNDKKESVEQDTETLEENFAVHKNGKPLKIKGKEVTARSKEAAQKAIDTMKKQPFNKDAKFTIVEPKSNSSSPQKTNQPYKIRRNRSSMPAWRYAERGE